MDWRMDDWSPSSRVSPFRHLRIKDYLHLPAAFRSLSRLSSALSAKASSLRSFLLNFLLQCVALHCFVLLLIFRWFPICLSTDVSVIDSSITHRICFFDVLLIINGLFIISLYEVLKVHWTLSEFHELSVKVHPDTWWGSSEPSEMDVSALYPLIVIKQSYHIRILSYILSLFHFFKFGGHLLSHTVAHAVSSAG